MNKYEIKKIVEGYKAHKVFFDLSIKPKKLKDEEYAKILKMQNFLAEQNEEIKYIREFQPIQFQKLQELSAELQNIIFQYWGSSVFK